MSTQFYSYSSFILYLFFLKHGEQYFLQEGLVNSVNANIYNSLYHIVQQHETDKTGITIFNSGSSDDEITAILSVIRKASTNGLYVFDANGAEIVTGTSCNIITLNSSTREFIYEAFLHKRMFDTRATIILFFINQYDEISQKKTLELLWRHQFFNVFSIIIVETEMYLFRYNGYKNSYEKIRSIDYTKNNLLEKTRNLNGHPINVLFTFNDHTKIRKVKDYEDKTDKYEGKDYDIIKTIFEHLNADLSVIDIDDAISDPTENPWFSNLEMENKSEVQKEILKKWNITMLTKSQRVLENDGVVEVTYPHTDNAITLLVPKRSKITKPEEVYNYVTQPVWYIHFLMLVVLSILLILLRKYYGIYDVVGPVRQLFRIMYTCSSYGFIGKNLEELLLLAWIIWCFLISIMVQAKITSMLSTDLYEDELDSLEDIYRKGKLDFITFGLNSYVEEIAEKYDGSKYMGIIADMVKVPMDENLGEIMLLEMPKPTSFKMGIILEHDIAKFYARHIKNRQDGWGRPYLHMMKHSLMPCFQVFHVTHGSPFLLVINRKINQLVEGGFIVYFKQKFLFKGLIDGYLYPDEDFDIDIYEPEPIGMGLAKYAFFLLFIGLIISTISFLIEICYYTLKKHFKL